LQQVSPAFTELWERHDVAQPENARKRILHNDLGLLQFTHTHSWLAARAGLRLVTYVPADEATGEALDQFHRWEPIAIR
jgi:hypothetical protein